MRSIVTDPPIADTFRSNLLQSFVERTSSSDYICNPDSSAYVQPPVALPRRRMAAALLSKVASRWLRKTGTHRSDELRRVCHETGSSVEDSTIEKTRSWVASFFSFAEAEFSLKSSASLAYDVHGVEFGIRSPGMFGTNLANENMILLTADEYRAKQKRLNLIFLKH